MNVKRLLAVTTCLVLAVAAGWTFLVVSYETNLGTDNTILVSDTGQKPLLQTMIRWLFCHSNLEQKTSIGPHCSCP